MCQQSVDDAVDIRPTFTEHNQINNRPSNSHGLTVRPPVRDTFPRSPGFTSNCHGELIPTLAPSLGRWAQPTLAKTRPMQERSALRARVLASPD